MPTPVPAVERATRIIEFLAERPRETVRLTQVAEALGIHKATCSAILAELRDKHLVHRDDRTLGFSLGPHLIDLATAASGRHQGLREARLEMFRLASDSGLASFVSVRWGDDMVVLDHIGGSDLGDLSVPIGQRTPLRPPLGTVFYAWAPEPVVDEWLERLGDETSAADVAAYRRALAAVRARGYSIGGRVEAEAQLDAALQRLASAGEHTERLAAAIQLVDMVRAERGTADRSGAPRDHRPQYLLAPIFDRRSSVVMTLTLYGRPSDFGEDALPGYTRALLAATRRVTAAIGGNPPAGMSALDALVEAPPAGLT